MSWGYVFQKFLLNSCEIHVFQNLWKFLKLMNCVLVLKLTTVKLVLFCSSNSSANTNDCSAMPIYRNMRIERVIIRRCTVHVVSTETWASCCSGVSTGCIIAAPWQCTGGISRVSMFCFCQLQPRPVPFLCA